MILGMSLASYSFTKYFSKKDDKNSKIGLISISLSDLPEANRINNSLSFRNLLILNKTDKNIHIGIVRSNIFGKSNMI